MLFFTFTLLKISYAFNGNDVDMTTGLDRRIGTERSQLLRRLSLQLRTTERTMLRPCVIFIFYFCCCAKVSGRRCISSLFFGYRAHFFVRVFYDFKSSPCTYLITESTIPVISSLLLISTFWSRDCCEMMKDHESSPPLSLLVLRWQN